MGVTPVESLTEFNKIIEKDKCSVFDFWATWCGPCKAMAPKFEAMSSEAEFEKMDFYKVDIEAQPAIAQEVGIRFVPAFMIFKNGMKVNEHLGTAPGLENVLKSCS